MDKKNKQIEYMEKNKSVVHFNPKPICTHNLPEGKRHLIDDGKKDG